MRLVFAPAAVAVAAAACLSATPARAQGAQRVYVMLADSVPMAVPAAASTIAGALTRHGWTVVADYPVPGDAARCGGGAHVIVARQAAHEQSLLAHGAPAAFAVPVRLSVFQDEAGVHVAMVNPLSIERTIVAETGLETAGRAMVDDLSGVVLAATHGRRVNRAYGQSRSRGLIGKTMGVMAGGAFPGQVETITSVPGSGAADVRRVADEIWGRLQAPPRGKWQLRGVYRMEFADRGMVVLGVSGAAMEAKAFDIVGAGDDDARARFKCPGIAYAAAFPLEVVIRSAGADVRVEVINAMFRMKMYFEDAGQMKFARNMLMPGSIADELRGLLIGGAR
jgi:hypothetical protein